MNNVRAHVGGKQLHRANSAIQPCCTVRPTPVNLVPLFSILFSQFLNTHIGILSVKRKDIITLKIPVFFFLLTTRRGCRAARALSTAPPSTNPAAGRPETATHTAEVQGNLELEPLADRISNFHHVLISSAATVRFQPILCPPPAPLVYCKIVACPNFPTFLHCALNFSSLHSPLFSIAFLILLHQLLVLSLPFFFTSTLSFLCRLLKSFSLPYSGPDPYPAEIPGS